jgi:hypothetical protein
MRNSQKRSAISLFVQEERACELMTSLNQVNSTYVNGIARLLHLEPARFWRGWRRFDGIGRRHVDLIKN